MLLVFGLVAGLFPRGWLFILVAAIGWPLLLLASEIDSGLDFVVAASVLGAANAAVGTLGGFGLRKVMIVARSR
jgi:hypothetical protein